MIRKTLTILSLISLLLSVGLWGVSYVLNMGCTLSPSGPQIGLAPGFLLVSITGLPAKDPLPEDYDDWKFGTRVRWFTDNTLTLKTGWRVDTSLRTPPAPWWEVQLVRNWPSEARLTLPFWIPSVFFGSSVWWLSGPVHRRRKRKKLGLCVKCGYNLRGLTEPRCPECNTPFDERLLKKDA